MSLDELLTAARDHRAEPDPGEITVPVVLKTLGGCAVAAFVSWYLLLNVGLLLPYPLLLAVLVALTLSRRITIASHGETLPEPDDHEDHEWLHESPHDQAYLGVRRWVNRLSTVEIDRDAYERRVRPAIVAVVDERLRLRHGIDRQADPRRAAAVLGEQLWQFVTEPATRVPRPQEVAALATRIEKL
ncbi:MAG: hypothetical protein ACRDT4_11950 [Micromonosporaceae bacterium]